MSHKTSKDKDFNCKVPNAAAKVDLFRLNANWEHLSTIKEDRTDMLQQKEAQKRPNHLLPQYGSTCSAFMKYLCYFVNLRILLV